jgi:SNF2 family DNA or RNA helicase
VQAIILILLFFAVRAQAGTKEAARVVIVVPANVLQNWMSELEKWLGLFTSSHTLRPSEEVVYMVCLPKMI